MEIASGAVESSAAASAEETAASVQKQTLKVQCVCVSPTLHSTSSTQANGAKIQRVLCRFGFSCSSPTAATGTSQCRFKSSIAPSDPCDVFFPSNSWLTFTSTLFSAHSRSSLTSLSPHFAVTPLFMYTRRLQLNVGRVCHCLLGLLFRSLKAQQLPCMSRVATLKAGK